ncbi:MAG TPA: glycosyltransferase, partial [Pirellulales bacterium]
MSQPEIALLMSTFERPRHLRLALESIARQSSVEGRMELVVTDDGSTDETPDIVRDFAARV